MRILDAFNRWFASAAGVWMTLALVLAVVVWEVAFPRTDPHGFWLLYWLTVYSAVTQPALAYIARKAGTEQSATLAHLQAILEHVEAMRTSDPNDPFPGKAQS